MSPVFSARRRAEEFDSLVGNPPTPGGSDARYAEFLEIVAALRDAPAVQPRAEFTRSLRERLMLAAETELVPAEEARLTLPARRPRDRRIAAAVGGLAIVGATTSMAMAAQSALPGDYLYPLKRAIENVQTGISADEGERGSTLLDNAEGRLEEVTALSRDGSGDDIDAIADTLNAFSEQAILASDLLLSDYESTGQEDSISELRDFTGSSMETLATLESLVPVEARDELIRAAMVLDTIDSAAAKACPDCAGVGITEIPVSLINAAGGSASGSTPTVDGTEATGPRPTKGKGKGNSTPSEEPGTGTSALPGGVLSPPTDGEGTDTKGGDDDTSGDAPSDPIGDLTQGLTGGGDSTPTSGSSGVPGLPDTDEVIDELDDVTDPLTGGSGDAKDDPAN